jgi:energy-converting hydrogenase Eha subunit H
MGQACFGEINVAIYFIAYKKSLKTVSNFTLLISLIGIAIGGVVCHLKSQHVPSHLA